MLPHTALKLKDTLSNKLKLSDYAKELSGPMGVTHILSFSQNKNILNLRIARTPSGPTMHFKVSQFSLAQHVRQIQRRPVDSKAAFQNAPIVVTNNFGDTNVSPHIKLMRITFQNMFPAINVATVKLADCRRVVLFNLISKKTKEMEDGNDSKTNNKDDDDDDNNNNNNEDDKDEEVEMRHYAIRATPVGIDRKVRRLVQCKLPNLKHLNDVSDYILGNNNSNSQLSDGGGSLGGNMSDSEAEDETSHVVLPQKYNGRGNAKSQKSALKLVELGPRLRLKLMKVQRGLGAGDVMYHAYVTKTAEEAKEMKKKVEDRENLKKRRREEQEANVARKERLKEEKKERKRLRKEERDRLAMEALRSGGAAEELQNDGDEDEDDRENDDSASEKSDINSYDGSRDESDEEEDQ